MIVLTFCSVITYTLVMLDRPSEMLREASVWVFKHDSFSKATGCLIHNEIRLLVGMKNRNVGIQIIMACATNFSSKYSTSIFDAKQIYLFKGCDWSLAADPLYNSTA